MAKKYMKRYSASLIIREMQIRTIADITPLLLEWLLSKIQEITRIGEAVE